MVGHRLLEQLEHHAFVSLQNTLEFIGLVIVERRTTGRTRDGVAAKREQVRRRRQALHNVFAGHKRAQGKARAHRFAHDDAIGHDAIEAFDAEPMAVAPKRLLYFFGNKQNAVLFA